MGGAAAEGSLGTISGVVVPTCENMWGVLIFLRFFYIVGHAGVGLALVVVLVSWIMAVATSLSLAAVATNGPVENGGAYFLISRALGHKVGGAVGTTYFVGISLLAVLEVLGAVEVLLEIAPDLSSGMSEAGAVRLWAVILLSALAGMVHVGLSFVSKMGIFFAAVVAFTLATYYAGLFAAPQGDVSPLVTGLSGTTLKDNWGPGYDSGVTFSDVLSVFFPCFTGILSGANRAKALKDPQRAIPVGTLSAICISAVMYTSYMLLWGAVADREYLKHGDSAGKYANKGRHLLGGGEESMGIVSDIAWPAALPTQIGIVIASLSQALQCLIVAPRLLHAIAEDGVVPFLRHAAPLRKGEPAMALLYTSILCLCACMIGSLELVAPLLSICFLTAYTALCLGTFIPAVMRAPSWRPTWRYYHWGIGLFGFVHGLALMFLIRWYFALLAIFMVGILFLYIERKAVTVDWGSALGGMRLQLAVSSMLELRHETRHAQNWRPQLLCLHKLHHTNMHTHEEMLGFAAMLKKGKGLSIVVSILEGSLVSLSAAVEPERRALEAQMEKENVRGFAHVVVAPSYRLGKSFVIQGLGIGGLEPNTVLLGWPHEWRSGGADHVNDAEVLVETVCECTAARKAIMMCYNLKEFPTVTERLTGHIDVWWIVHDGGLLLLVAHLLQKHKTWAGCQLRVHTIVTVNDNSELVKRNLVALLQGFRIAAEVEVVEVEETPAAYTHDWTLRRQQAELYVEQMKLWRPELAPVSELAEAEVGGEGERVSGEEPRRRSLSKDDEESGKRRSRSSFSSLAAAVNNKTGMNRSGSSVAFPQEIDMVSAGVNHDVSTSEERPPALADIFPELAPSGELAPKAAAEAVDAAQVAVEVEPAPGDGAAAPGGKAGKGKAGNAEKPTDKGWNQWTGLSEGPTLLNKKIIERSSDASLVLLNLPDPDKLVVERPAAYMEYVEELVRGLKRVLFCHGTGRESFISSADA